MENISQRDAFFDKLYEIASKDRNVVLVTADMSAPSLDKFRDDIPEQYVKVGIAEQNLVAVATGLALAGKTVFIYAIMPFVTLRCYEIIKVELCMMNIPVTAIGVGSGVSYDDSGPTHHATEDIAIMRALPNMTILNSSDSVMAARLAEMTCNISGPHYVRLDREMLPSIYKQNDDFSAGLTSFKDGSDVCIIATGNMVHQAFEIADRLAKKSVKARIIDLYRLKPINENLLLEAIKPVKHIVTLEENQLNGGMGSAVAEILVDNNVTTPVKRFGINDRYLFKYGGRQNLLSLFGLDTDTVTQAILKWLH